MMTTWGFICRTAWLGSTPVQPFIVPRYTATSGLLYFMTTLFFYVSALNVVLLFFGFDTVNYTKER